MLRHNNYRINVIEDILKVWPFCCSVTMASADKSSQGSDLIRGSVTAIKAEDLCLKKSEKIELISKQIEELHAKCTAAGLGDEDTRECASSFVNARRVLYRKTLLRRLFAYSLLVTALCGAFYFESSYNWIVAHARLASIQLVPYYDFTIHYNDQCLIDNPLYQERTTELNCDMCKELGDSVERVKASEVRPTVLMNDFLDVQIPIVVTNALGSWPAMKNGMDLQDIYKLYMNSEMLRNSSGSERHCQIVGPVDDLGDVLSALSNTEAAGSYSIAWQNCEMEAYKEFRKVYRRLDFLPPAAEASNYNVVVASFGKEKEAGAFAAQSLSLLQGGQDLAIWIGQVTGELHYTLSPATDCPQCQSFDVILRRNEFLLVPVELWEVSFRPASAAAPDSYAIMSGLFWDRS